MKKLIFIFSCLIAFFSSAVATEFKNVFESSIYSSYMNQLEQFFLDHPLNNQMESEEAFVKAFDEFYSHAKKVPTHKNPEEKARFHKKMISLLRKAIQERQQLSDNSDERALFLDNFTEWMFTKPDLKKPLKKFIAKSTSLDEEIITSIYHLAPKSYILALHYYLNLLPNFAENKIGDSEKSLDDSAGSGDLPHFLYHLKNRKKTGVMRIVNVTKDLEMNESGKVTKAQVNEEFLNYIQKISREGKKHLYVNLMGRKVDKHKVREIEALEENPTTSEGVIVISLDKENSSEFYFQVGIYEKMFSADEFKKTFKDLLFKPDGNYYWSKKLEMEMWQNKIDDIMQDVHQIYFDNSPYLSQEERQEFIELVYVKIVDALVQLFNPEVMNMSCKHSADRGPSLYTLFYLHEHAKEKRLDVKYYTDAAYFLFAPPLVFQGRGSHLHRVYRMQGAANRLLK